MDPVVPFENVVVECAYWKDKTRLWCEEPDEISKLINEFENSIVRPDEDETSAEELKMFSDRQDLRNFQKNITFMRSELTKIKGENEMLEQIVVENEQRNKRMQDILQQQTEDIDALKKKLLPFMSTDSTNSEQSSQDILLSLTQKLMVLEARLQLSLNTIPL